MNFSTLLLNIETGMTQLGEFLAKKSISKASVANRTGISRSRMSELTNNPTTHLKAKEFYLIALAIDVEPCETLKEVYKEVKLLA